MKNGNIFITGMLILHKHVLSHGISSLVRLLVKLVMIASFSVIQVNSGNFGMKYLE